MLSKPSARFAPWMRRLAMSGLAAAALCVAAAPAGAQRDGREYRERRDDHRRDRGYERRHDWDRDGRRGWGDDRYRYRGPPPPVYYQPRPVYVPPPVYYGAPRGPSFNLFLR